MANQWSINTGSYPYASDLGVDSIAMLTTLCRSSGIDFRVGSSYRVEPGSWHYSKNAIDVFASTKDMTRLAAYLIQYHAYLGELLYTPPNAQQLPNGRWAPVYAVDNAVILNSLSDRTAREHGWANAHVHLAATVSGLRAAAKETPKLLRQWQKNEKAGVSNSVVSAEDGVVTSAPAFRSGAGCAPKAAAFILGTAVPLSTLLYLAQR